MGRPKSSCHLKGFFCWNWMKLVILLSDISSELGVSNFVCKDLGPPPFDPSGHTDQVGKGGLRSGKWRGFLRCFVGNDSRYTYAHIHKSIHVYNICICRYILMNGVWQACEWFVCLRQISLGNLVKCFDMNTYRLWQTGLRAAWTRGSLPNHPTNLRVESLVTSMR